MDDTWNAYLDALDQFKRVAERVPNRAPSPATTRLSAIAPQHTKPPTTTTTFSSRHNTPRRPTTTPTTLAAASPYPAKDTLRATGYHVVASPSRGWSPAMSDHRRRPPPSKPSSVASTPLRTKPIPSSQAIKKRSFYAWLDTARDAARIRQGLNTLYLRHYYKSLSLSFHHWRHWAIQQVTLRGAFETISVRTEQSVLREALRAWRMYVSLARALEAFVAKREKRERRRLLKRSMRALYQNALDGFGREESSDDDEEDEYEGEGDEYHDDEYQGKQIQPPLMPGSVLYQMESLMAQQSSESAAHARELELHTALIQALHAASSVEISSLKRQLDKSQERVSSLQQAKRPAPSAPLHHQRITHVTHRTDESSYRVADALIAALYAKTAPPMPLGGHMATTTRSRSRSPSPPRRPPFTTKPASSSSSIQPKSYLAREVARVKAKHLAAPPFTRPPGWRSASSDHRAQALDTPSSAHASYQARLVAARSAAPRLSVTLPPVDEPDTPFTSPYVSRPTSPARDAATMQRVRKEGAIGNLVSNPVPRDAYLKSAVGAPPTDVLRHWLGNGNGEEDLKKDKKDKKKKQKENGHAEHERRRSTPSPTPPLAIDAEVMTRSGGRITLQMSSTIDARMEGEPPIKLGPSTPIVFAD